MARKRQHNTWIKPIVPRSPLLRPALSQFVRALASSGASSALAHLWQSLGGKLYMSARGGRRCGADDASMSLQKGEVIR